MKVVVYASPHYFTKGSSFDGREWNPCFGAGTGDPVGLELGGNSSSYLDALSKLLNDYPELDGVYFDEIYPFNLPESYAVTRETRKLLGSGKINNPPHDASRNRRLALVHRVCTSTGILPDR